MFGLLWMFLSNPMTVLVALALVVILIGLVGVLGVPRTLKIVSDPRVVLAALLVAGVLGYVHLSQENQKLKAEIAQTKVVDRAQDDALRAIRSRIAKREVRQKQTDRITRIIVNSEEGKAHDAVLDEIARIQQGGAVDEPSPVVDGVRDGDPDGMVRP